MSKTTCCPPRTPPGRSPELRDWVPVLKALADETRLEMFGRLLRTKGSICACDLEEGFDLAQPTISHHLKLLRDAGLVTTERRGTWIHYAANREAAAKLGTFLGRLDAA